LVLKKLAIFSQKIVIVILASGTARWRLDGDEQNTLNKQKAAASLTYGLYTEA
jgi:hypothetical protein